MARYFNIAGPCISSDHYMINASERLGSETRELINKKQYFVIHAARQTGKTTLLKEINRQLNAEGNCHSLYCSLEVLQDIAEAKEGIPAIVKTIHSALNNYFLPNASQFAQNADYNDYANVLQTSIIAYCRTLAKPLVILFDEADCLSDSTLISFLRQLRSGYINRPDVPFAQSIVLVGMRNIRDYKSRIREARESLGTSSPFNIISESMNLRNFTKEEVTNLYGQHTAETGQIFEQDALDLAFEQTNGQPWLVNAIARECVEKILKEDYSQKVTADMVSEAVKTLILRRDVNTGKPLRIWY